MASSTLMVAQRHQAAIDADQVQGRVARRARPGRRLAASLFGKPVAASRAESFVGLAYRYLALLPRKSAPRPTN